VVHAQAAELMGMACIYLEAGSGAQLPVPPEMIKAVSNAVSIPVIVGGGIRSAADAVKAASSGARAIVVGTAVEQNGTQLIGEMVSALRRL
jgi:geranylgeranylglyceryl phosphate synthase family protein